MQARIADLVMIAVPDLSVLRARRSGDTSRRRRSFELHSALAEPLRAWYRAVEALEPGRVVWRLPEAGLPQVPNGPRTSRTDPVWLDHLVDVLPAH